MQSINEIQDYLEEFEDGWGELAYMEGEHVEGILGLVSGVESVGGMGKGEYRHVVLRIQQGETFRYFKKVGCYVSHDGTHWDGPFTEVEQRQKTITVWE